MPVILSELVQDGLCKPDTNHLQNIYSDTFYIVETTWHND